MFRDFLLVYLGILKRLFYSVCLDFFNGEVVFGGYEGRVVGVGDAGVFDLVNVRED